MIDFLINIENPYSKLFENIKCFHGKITKNKSYEIEILRTNVIFSIKLSILTYTDHSGIRFEMGLCSLTLSFNIYDNRHFEERF